MIIFKVYFTKVVKKTQSSFVDGFIAKIKVIFLNYKQSDSVKFVGDLISISYCFIGYKNFINLTFELSYHTH